MNRDNPTISVVIPIFNEEEVIPELIHRLEDLASSNSGAFILKIVFVDDGSTDKSVEVIISSSTELKYQLIQLSRNFGHQAAVMAGISKADGGAVVIMDADLQDPPELISEFVKYWQDGFHVVYGKRISRTGESTLKIASAALFYRFLHWLTEVDIPLDSGDFRLIDRKVADDLTSMNEKSVFIRGLIAWMGYKQTPVEYHREARFAGETKYPLKKMFALASDAVLAFSEKPLRLISKIGGAIFFISIALSIFGVISKIFGSGYEAPGWISIMLAILTLSGFQILCLGVIGSYILRVYRQTRDRPIYLVMDEFTNYG